MKSTTKYRFGFPILVLIHCVLVACCGNDDVLELPDDIVLCGDTYVDIQTDENYCGSCDTSCRIDQVCSDGLCECPDKMTDCDGICVDTMTDNENCGSCGASCCNCLNGECLECPSGFSECMCECIDLDNDINNCGTCGNACVDGQYCIEGECQFVDSCIDLGLTNCYGYCVDMTSNNDHCGICGNKCTGDTICQDGLCEGCPDTLTYCEAEGICADLLSDEQHCGACTTICDPGYECICGSCLTEPIYTLVVTCGETSVVMGSTVQCVAQLTSCLPSIDVTGSVRWLADDPNGILQISANGLVAILQGNIGDRADVYAELDLLVSNRWTFEITSYK